MSSFLLLLEAADYAAMFRDFIAVSPNNRQTIDKYVKWARTTLKKNDRIVWFLRFARVELAGTLHIKNSDEELIKLNQKLGTNFARHDLVPLNNLMTNLTHFMALPVPAIQKVVWDRQTPQELLETFHDAEAEWKQTADDDADAQEMHKAGRLIAADPRDDIILKCPDGLCWVDLGVSSCRIEGRAMGHCGNQGGRHSDTVLSLRRPVKMQGATYWYPVATFILDQYGFLGEMKGRGNDKPAERYHPDIILLLRSDRIKGIKGGGYLPENNFSLSDLDHYEREALLKEKPELGGVYALYEKEGMTQRVRAILTESLRARGLDTPDDYDEAGKLFIMEEWTDFEQFFRSIDDENCEKLLEIATGESDITRPVENLRDEFLTMAADLPDDWRAKLVQRAGFRPEHNDDHTVAKAALELVKRRDPWFEVFEDVTHSREKMRNEALDRLDQYMERGWSFYCSEVWVDHAAGTFREALETNSPVKLVIHERSLLVLASADSNDDDGYEEREIADHGWDGVNWDYQFENLREEHLIDRDRKDTWLAGVSETETNYTEAFMDAIAGAEKARIEDPNQLEMFPRESVDRLKQLAGLLS